MFSDEPSIRVGQEFSKDRKFVSDCYGDEVVNEVAWEPVVSAGVLLGTSSEMRWYIQKVANELQTHVSCAKPGADQGIHNVLSRGSRAGVPVHVHENRRGPVWTGGRVQKEALLLDDGNLVLNEEGHRYAVLHQYDQHEALWRILKDRFIKQIMSAQPAGAVTECDVFDVQAGDLRGMDHSHVPATNLKECCAVCLQDAGCGGFVYSDGRQHCWLKRYGISVRSPANPGDDAQAGLRRSSPTR
eukprot:gnl/TRDRNA2_/TRDRNA2_130762_c1_seq2.p1 gnl/TRDRNA2_/TRDRNA2_130762_c1~~gnl/TRDRNA2_/TRDRNA2_130762_c1_seq2.p1  ORF type:complete len:243 (+),score=48.19 gnl/TRDRNA2_/TRDRNA2_130762_c1_seq2:108-836(+)